MNMCDINDGTVVIFINAVHGDSKVIQFMCELNMREKKYITLQIFILKVD